MKSDCNSPYRCRVTHVKALAPERLENYFPGKVTICFPYTMSILHHLFYYGLHYMCSINVSAHYYRERGERSFVGLAGVALRPGEASQSGETCVRAS